MEDTNLSQTGTIFNIQKFSVHDGPGIRTVVFFKGCPLRCKWCSNPESQLHKIQILWDKKSCVGCHHCVEVCPTQSISIKDDSIIIHHQTCSSCLRCANECPGKALRIEGEIKTVKEVMDLVLQDKVFYEESGGGITLSGGEMLNQPLFAKEILQASKQEGIHTCCETTGYANPETFQELLPYFDMVLFDFKHANPIKHKEGTGVSNELILQNLEYALHQNTNLLIRIPVIPNFNHTLEDAKEIIAKLKELGIQECQLLPFHQYGENKYSLLNREYEYENQNALHQEDLTEYQSLFIQNGIHAFY